MPCFYGGFWYIFMKWYRCLLGIFWRLELSGLNRIWTSFPGEWVLALTLEFWGDHVVLVRVYKLMLVRDQVGSVFIVSSHRAGNYCDYLHCWINFWKDHSVDMVLISNILGFSLFSCFVVLRSDICPKESEGSPFLFNYLLWIQHCSHIREPLLLAYKKAKVFTHFNSLKIPSGYHHSSEFVDSMTVVSEEDYRGTCPLW